MIPATAFRQLVDAREVVVKPRRFEVPFEYPEVTGVPPREDWMKEFVWAIQRKAFEWHMMGVVNIRVEPVQGPIENGFRLVGDLPTIETTEAPD